MANSSVSTGLQYHVRSISLPSRLNPHSVRVEAELNKLKTWEKSLVSSMVPLSAETIGTGLVWLADLYNSVEDLIHSPITQKALLQHQNGVLVEEALEGSIGLLDSCSVARDLLLTMKEHVMDLQSALRRKGGDLSIQSNINAYNSSKKKVKKETAKCLRAMKQMENKIASSSLLDVNHNHYLSMVIRVFREVASVTISVLRFFFSFLSVSDPKTRLGGWTLIKKLMVPRAEGHETSNEMVSVDDVLQSLNGCKRSNNVKIDVQMARRRLEGLGDGMEGLEAGLDCLFRRLIQNRVSLLNILAQY